MHIIFYVLDSLRADHLSCYGYQRQTSPNIDSIAEEGAIFNRCYSTSTWTRPVAASILSGTYPAIIGVQGRKDYFDSSLIRLPELLQREGFKTACFSAIGNVSTILGFARGFDHFCDLYKEPSLMDRRVKTSGGAEGLEDEMKEDVIFPLAGDINAFFLPWLEKNKSENTFSLLWSIQTHEPYDPPEEFNKYLGSSYDGRYAGHRDMIRRVRNEADRKFLIDLYDGEIYYNDFCIGEIIRYLKNNGLYEDSILVILGDHGESLGEHGIYSHGHMPYEQVIRVPLIIKFRQNEFAGKLISQLTSLMDLFPSISEYIGIPLPEELIELVKGKSMLNLLRENQAEFQPYLFAETKYSDAKPTFQAVISNQYKYIKVIPTKLKASIIKTTFTRLFQEKIWLSILRNPLYMFKRYGQLKHNQLFDLQTDPNEIDDLAINKPEVVQEMEKLLMQWEDECSQLSAHQLHGGSEHEDDETLRKHLRALGYMD